MTTDPPVAAGDGIVDDDVICYRCGYNLRAARRDGRCPECGAAVIHSLQGDLLCDTDPAWLLTLRHAIILSLVSMVLTVVLTYMQAGRAPPFVILLPQLLNGALNLLAMWLLTTPEPRAWTAERALTLRVALRLCAVCSFAGQLFQLSASLLPHAAWLGVIGISLGLACLPSMWLYFLFLARLARRIPDESLTRHCHRAMVGLTISIGVILVGALIARTAATVGLVLVCPALIGVAGFGILALAVQYLLVTFLSAAAREFRD